MFYFNYICLWFFSCILIGNNFSPTFLGEYFRTDEFADQSQENLSSSSLRRKLFLEENGNVSACLSPSLHSPCGSQPLGVLCSIELSPVRCRSPLDTSSSVSSLFCGLGGMYFERLGVRLKDGGLFFLFGVFFFSNSRFWKNLWAKVLKEYITDFLLFQIILCCYSFYSLHS